MAGRIILDGFNPAFDSDGNIDDGCTVTFYENGTTTLQTIYAEADLQTPLANPLSPDAAGRFDDVWAPDDYAYSLKVEWTNGDIRNRNDVVAAFSNSHEVPVYLEGAVADGETFPVYLPLRNLRLPKDLVESRFSIKGNLPTATATFTLKKNGSSIGTISFATDGTPTVAFASSVDFTDDDDFQMDGPSPDDATMTDVSFNFNFQVR